MKSISQCVEWNILYSHQTLLGIYAHVKNETVSWKWHYFCMCAAKLFKLAVNQWITRPRPQYDLSHFLHLASQCDWAECQTKSSLFNCLIRMQQWRAVESFMCIYYAWREKKLKKPSTYSSLRNLIRLRPTLLSVTPNWLIRTDSEAKALHTFPCLFVVSFFLFSRCYWCRVGKLQSTEKIELNFNWTLQFSCNDIIYKLISWYLKWFTFASHTHFHLTVCVRHTEIMLLCHKISWISVALGT